MLKPLAFVAAIALASPLAALDLSSMSDDERAAFRSEVRAYLLDNPEVLMEAIGVLEQRQAEMAAAGDQQMLVDNAEALFDDGFSFVGGNPDGDITIAEFMDYRCGYCKKAFPEVEELINADGNIRFIVKEYPILGDQSVLAARFAIAVKNLHGTEVYKDLHDTLMTMKTDITPEALVRLAESFALDADEIVAKMDSDDVTREIRETALLGQRMQVTGTPTFIIGSEVLRGYVPLSAMEEIVAKARQDG